MSRSRRFSLPFRDMTGSEISLGAWHFRSDSGDLVLAGESIAGWDYLKPIELHREIDIDGHKVADTCDLPEDATFALTVTAHSPSARYRRLAFRSADLHRKPTKVAVRFALDGTLLSRDLRLETEVLLCAPGKSKAPFVATLPGSRLFSEVSHIDLEGNGSRMPIEIADLASQIPGLSAPHAAWHVLVETTDLHSPTMRALRVFLNSRHTTAIESAQTGDTLFLSLLGADVARRLLSVALQDEDFLTNPDDFGDGSIGEASRRLLRLCFPGQSPKNVAAVAAATPARFESAIQSCMRIGDV